MKKTALLVHENCFGRTDYLECRETPHNYIWNGYRISKKTMTLWDDRYHLASPEEFEKYRMKEKASEANEIIRDLSDLADSIGLFNEVVGNKYVELDEEKLKDDLEAAAERINEFVEELKNEKKD